MSIRMRAPTALFCMLAIMLHAQAQTTASSSVCGSLENAYGPYDYTNPTHKRERLPIVEVAHLTADVLQLRHGATGESTVPDLEYTLRAFPNHHLALDALARLHRREHTEHLPGGLYSMSCWFERARRFNASDGVVPLIYGVHEFYLEHFGAAEEGLKDALRLMPNSAEAHYNLGLLYVRMGDYARAVEHAEPAYALGFPLPGLRNQLAKLGKWPGED